MGCAPARKKFGLEEEAAGGESFIIAKAGKPMVKVVTLDAPDPSKTRARPEQGPSKARRIGFLTGRIQVPDDFDQMGAETISALFGDEA